MPQRKASGDDEADKNADKEKETVSGKRDQEDDNDGDGYEPLRQSLPQAGGRLPDV